MMEVDRQRFFYLGTWRRISLMTGLFVKPTDTHQFLDPSFSHPYHCKKGIPYSQALTLNRICSDNESFGKRCKDLEG